MESRKLVISVSLAVLILCGLVYLLVAVLGKPGVSTKPAEDGIAAPAEPEGTEDLAGPSRTRENPGGASSAEASEGEPEAAAAAITDTRPVSIEGRVTGTEGQGIPQARLVVLEKKAWEETIERDRRRLDRNPFEAMRAFEESLRAVAQTMPSTESDDDGMYQLRGLKEGDFRVFASHADFLPHREQAWVTVEEGKTARYDIELIKGNRIAGTVLDEEGKPVAEALVKARPVEEASLRGFGKMIQTLLDQSDGKMLLETGTAITDDEGVFRLGSLEPRDYNIKVEKAGYAWSEVRKVPAGTESVVIALSASTRVVGRVLDPGHDPVSGAKVTLKEPDKDLRKLNNPLAIAMVDFDIVGEKTRRATTDEEGHFALDSFQDAKYELVVDAEGYPVFRDEFRVEGGTVNVGDVILPQLQSISGRVLGPSGLAVEGAEVFVPKAEGDTGQSRRPLASRLRDRRRFGDLDADVTDAGGEFRLSRLEPGRYDLVATAEGYVGAILREVETGQRGVTIRLQEGITITGIVLDAEDKGPVPGVTVRESLTGATRDVTSDDGRFELHGIDPDALEKNGRHIFLSTEHDEYQRSFQRYPFSADQGEPVTITLLRKKGLEGFVMDDRGQPVKNARVSVEVPGFPAALLNMSPDGSVDATFTDAEGGFFIAAMPRMGGDTSYEVVATYPGFAKARYGPLKRPKDGESWPLVEIYLSRGTSIGGRVTDIDGAPVEGAQIRARRNVKLAGELMMFSMLMPPAVGHVAYSSAGGGFSVARIEPGIYQVEVRALGFAKKMVPHFEVTEAPATLDFSLDPGGTIRGRVVDHEQRPLAGIEVVAFLRLEERTDADDPRARGRERMQEEMVKLGGLGAAMTKSSAEGTYELTHLPEGEFRVVARAPGYRPDEIESVTAGDRVPDLVLAPHSKIVGRVLDGATGGAVRNYEVRLERTEKTGDMDLWRNRQPVDHPEGLFEYDQLGDGEYRVKVTARDYVPASKVVPLPAGSEIEVEVVLDPGSRIEGVVYAAGSKGPIPGASIYLRSTSNAEGYDWTYNQERRTDEDGRFLLGGLQDGTYRVSISHPEFYPDERNTTEFRIPLEEPTELSVAMHSAGRVKGKIRNLPPIDRRTGGYHLVLTLIDETGPGRNADAGEPAARKFTSQAWLREDGGYLAESVRPGKYQVELLERHWRPREEGQKPPEPTKRYLGEVEVHAGDIANFDASVR